jgi:hypothetical protein
LPGEGNKKYTRFFEEEILENTDVFPEKFGYYEDYYCSVF